MYGKDVFPFIPDFTNLNDPVKKINGRIALFPEYPRNQPGKIPRCP